MADTLTVRTYNVRFGDAILVTVPDRDPSTGQTTRRHILIDVGNAPLVASREGGDDAVFEPVIDDILEQLDRQPVDLYVMTHEHLDHVQGLPWAAWRVYENFAASFLVDYSWLTASSAPDYYDTHPDAKRKKLAFQAAFTAIQHYLGSHAVQGATALAGYLANNDPASTTRCVEYLRGLARRNTSYVSRGQTLAGTHPFAEARFEILAPEEDTSSYYGRLQPLALDASPAGSPPGPLETPSVPPSPPPGVDLGAFLDLYEARQNGIGDNLLAIDKAANNTSVVFTLDWRGWRLLFAGDAELKSWAAMRDAGVLKPVDFLKAAHHGSHNGTPADEILDLVMPASRRGVRKRTVAVSTWRNTYPGIPHPPTDQRLAARGDLRTTLDDEEALYFDVEFEG